MATRDRAKRLAAQRRYRERQKIAKYGPAAAGVNMSGRHGNHARGPANGRSDHAREHALERGRDALGRFPPADLRVRDIPKRSRP